MYQNNNSKIKECQEHLKKPTEKKLMQEVFLDFMSDKKIKLSRLADCGNVLRFLATKDKKNFKLSGGIFCHNRFCPLCSWIKAKKTAFEILELLEYARVLKKKEFIFITLTAKNVKAKDLKSEITDFNKSFKRLFETKNFEKINHGFIKKIEVTYNEERDDFHPHLHIIVAVNSSYFTSRDYISRAKLLEMWRKAKRDDSITQVDVRKIHMNSIKEVLEIATYSTKQNQLYSSKEIFDVLYTSLYRRQLLTFNKLFKELRKLQNLKELDLSELVNLDEIRIKAELEIYYKFNEDLKNYEFDLEKEFTSEEEFYDLNLEID